MRTTFLVAIIAGFMIGAVVLGVRLLSGDDGSEDDPVVESVPSATATAAAGSPQAVAEAFIAAWSAENYDALYTLLSPASQQSFSQLEIEDEYETFALETTQTAVDGTVTAASATEASVAVALSTRYFDMLEYDVTLSLAPVDGPQGYAIDWQLDAIYPGLVEGQQVISEVTRPDRGTIFDRHGAPLAETQRVEMVGLNRSLITDTAAISAALMQLGFTQDVTNAALASPLGSAQRVPVGQVPDGLADVASQLARETPGLVSYREDVRVHPAGAAAAHVVGYTRELTAEELEPLAGAGYRPGDRTGALGLEASMNDVLAGVPGGELRIEDASGAVVSVIATRDYVQGQDVHTTLDTATMQAAYERLGGRAGAIVVMAPVTNEVLAMVSSPSYDPDAFEHGDQEAINQILASTGEPLLNRVAMGTYSAGSVFKLVTGAAGMVSLGLTTTDTLECSAMWDVIDPPRANWEGAQGPLTIAQALMRSCNPVFYQIGYDLYYETDGALSEMARQFGYGAPTGTVGIYEEAGLVPDAAWKMEARGEEWYPGDNVNLAIGQGDLLITPIQLANAYSTFVTDTLRTPVLIAGEPATERGTLPLTPEQHASLLQGLQLVTSVTGTAGYAFAEQGYYDFAGKSGTAEDSGEQQHVLFVAMSPAAAPTVVAAVVLDEGESGSLEAGPIARDAVLAAMATAQ